MGRDRQSVGTCGKCQRGTLTCSHNRFDNGTLVIDSWEHRCADCGHRETQAFRSDQPSEGAASDPLRCPFCGRQGS